jgi:hypothetical protein
MMGSAVRKAIGAYIAALGGLDLFVFMGEIGKHSDIQFSSARCSKKPSWTRPALRVRRHQHTERPANDSGRHRIAVFAVLDDKNTREEFFYPRG